MGDVGAGKGTWGRENGALDSWGAQERWYVWGLVTLRSPVTWGSRPGTLTTKLSQELMGAVGSHRGCMSKREPWLEWCAWEEVMGRVPDALVTVLGSALGLQTWGTCCEAHPPLMLPSGPTPVKATCEPLCVQACQGPSSILHMKPPQKRRPGLDLAHLGSRDSSGVGGQAR